MINFQNNAEYVKATDSGLITGAMILFHKVDLEDEYFTPQTETMLNIGDRVLTYYHHTYDSLVKAHAFTHKMMVASIDELGVWFEHQLELANEYERKVFELLRERKLGVSTQALPTTVVKANFNNRMREIKRWHAIEASYTPIPAEPSTRFAISVKSIEDDEYSKALVEIDQLKKQVTLLESKLSLMANIVQL